MMAAELAATGASVMRWFQGLSAGKSCWPSSAGTVRSSRRSRARVKRRARPTVGCTEPLFMPAALANLNGQMMPLDEVRISALDRGFLFGDAVYEVLRVYHAKPWLEREHLERLARSLALIRIAGVDVQRLQQRMHETIRAGGFGECAVYLQVTRGAAYPRRHA